MTVAWQDHFVILNVAVGRGHPGNPTSETIRGYDASMRVRYRTT